MKQIVTAISTHELYYCIDHDRPLTREEVERLLENGMLSDFAQKWEGERVLSIKQVTDEEYQKLMEEKNPVLADEASFFVNEIEKLNEGSVED